MGVTGYVASDEIKCGGEKTEREGDQRYNDEQKMTEFGRSSISEALSNFS